MNAEFNLRLAVLAMLPALALSGWAASYHVDSDAGDDTRSGISPALAWKSLERANTMVFQPGDQLLFKAGSRHIGQLKPQGSGAIVEGKPVPIRIGKYGGDVRPRIDGEGQVLDTLLLRNVEFWEVADLELTNLGTNRVPWRTGAHVVTDGFGRMRHIRLNNLFVHDVNGDLRKNQEGCGIYFESRGGNQSHFDGLVIENCHVVRTDRNGICQRNGSRTRSLGVVIRGNLLEDIGGDGIKLWGSNGGLVERNIVRGGRMRCEDYAAGIWPFDCDDAVIQFNEVSGYKGTRDGQGFDSDYLCRRTVIQYNYSHDNEGGFILICAPGNSYNEDTVVRYNISQNDGLNSARVFHISGVKNTKIYNNTIYVGAKQDLPLLKFTEWSRGWASNTWIANNIFYVDGRVTYDLGRSTGTVFENNVFFGHHVNAPNDSHAITNRPPLLKPGGGANGMESLTAYRLAELPDFMRGKLIMENGGHDILGNVIPKEGASTIGAFEFRR